MRTGVFYTAQNSGSHFNRSIAAAPNEWASGIQNRLRAVGECTANLAQPVLNTDRQFEPDAGPGRLYSEIVHP
jgi:hypothetical protein